MAQERRDAVTLVPLEGGDYNPEDDLNNAFEGWRAATEEAAVPGKVTAWQIPMDDHGIPQPSAKNQIRLGSWPIDAYKFDDLCAMLVKEFMPPEKILCVRLMGSKAGERGLQFNRVVILRAPNETKNNNASGMAGGESLSALMKTIQESNERTLALIQRMQPQPAQTDATVELRRILEISMLLNKPMQDMMTQLLPALAGRPIPTTADPFAGISGLIDVATKLAELKGGGGESGNGPDWLEAIKAVVPLAKPALEAIVATRPVAVIPQPRPILAPPPSAAPGTPSPPAASRMDGSQPSAPLQTPPPASGMSMGDIPSGDIEMFAQLKPQIDSLVQIARDGGDPVGAADLLFEEMILPLPDDYYNKFSDLFGRENLVSQLAVFHPAVLQYREFFEKFRKQVDARFDKEDVEAGDRPTNLESVK